MDTAACSIRAIIAFLVSTENKQQITLRLDSEVLKFFKKTGARYQSRINAVLREYVNAHRKVAEGDD